ncbi:heavy-metal-associated domain-containing protein [Ruania rhizosphaerae]|uniref:heavy-metal-associated domain-containing protein n=1 Tax=Ruania rhizosphaerae TaxID=1840413 RepID=UPI001357ED31|nr:heavy-metal-associated domain-containing protein [Ruania rhizosphaerae]
MTTTTIDVTGMTCGNCVAHVTAELKEIDGVSDVSVDLHQGEASPVTITSTSQVEEAAIRAAVDEAGYQVTAIH